MNSKKWYQSNTIQFFVLMLGAGGLDLVMNFVQNQEVSWRSVVMLVMSLIGLALRLKTNQAIE